VHEGAIRQAALDLIAQGVNDCEVSRRLGVPRRTVRDWRVPPSVSTRATCLRCWKPTSQVIFSAADYAELLGLYLGDGHISAMPRTERLRLTLDAKYPVVVDEAADLIGRIVLDNKVGRQFRHEGRMVTLRAYHRHWSCLFRSTVWARSTIAGSSWSPGRRRS